MNPFILVDYVYYTFVYIYGVKFGYFKEKEYMVSSWLGLLQTANVATIVLFVWKPLPEFIKANDLLIVAIGFIILTLLNIIRYKKIISYSELSDKWDKEERKMIWLKRTGVIFYFIMTYIFLILAAVK